MAVRESVACRGQRPSRLLRHRAAEGLVGVRHASGLSVRAVARLVQVSPSRIARLEAGDPGTTTIDLVARVAAALGLELAASLYPSGDPIRDRAHLALLERLRARLPQAARWRTEVPVPILGDLRSGDAIVSTSAGDVLIEAETHVSDVQLVERRSSAKARDLGAIRLILLIADTRHHWTLLRDHPEVRERFPVGTKAALAALRGGRDPGADGLIVL